MQLDLFQSRVTAVADRLVSGLRYMPSFLSADAESKLLRYIDGLPWLDDLKRRVQHYGYRYDYKARRVSRSMRIGELPGLIADLGQRLAADGLMPESPDQAIVNEYLPGQGISAHVDCEPCFGPCIVTVSLGSACEMEFSHPDGRRETLILEPRSALVIADEARYQWTHAIRARKSDHGAPRGRRVSITFRKVIPGE